ncbi:sodium/glutamate symporter, partial [Rhodopirellula maiorica SM1]
MIAALLFVTFLLLVGVALRIRFGIFQWLYIPASVIAGILGLAVIQLAPENVSGTTEAIATTLSDWPNLLIAVVFAGMLLERKPTEHRENASNVGREALMVWIIVLGQTAVGLLVTWIFIQPFYDLPNSFGMLIE